MTINSKVEQRWKHYGKIRPLRKSQESIKSIRTWFSRKLMAYNVVNTMDAFLCAETLKMAIERRYYENCSYCADLKSFLLP